MGSVGGNDTSEENVWLMPPRVAPPVWGAWIEILMERPDVDGPATLFPIR